MMDPASLRAARLAKRLLLAVGGAPLACSVLHGCGCGKDANVPVDFDEIVDQRELIQLGADQMEANCWDGGLAGAGGLAPVCDEPFPDDIYPPPQYWDPPQVDVALSWDPESGCPSPEQYEAIRNYTSHGGWTVVKALLPSEDGSCLYTMQTLCGEGRPFLVGREVRVAPLIGSEAHEASTSDLERQLILAWCRDAQAEHASIAAFARLSLQLMALGAPLDLVRAAQMASLDEAEHAALCLEEATRHGGGPFTWGPLDTTGACDDPSTRELFITNIIEGCIGETLAAARARAQAECTTSPDLARRLHTLADDEERHAALAWQILAWQLQSADASFRQLAIEVLQSQNPRAETVDAPHEGDGAWQAAGRLRASEAAEIDRITWQKVITPVAALLLASKTRAKAARGASSQIS